MYDHDENRQELVPKLTHHDKTISQILWSGFNKACYNAILIKIENTVVESKGI